MKLSEIYRKAAEIVQKEGLACCSAIFHVCNDNGLDWFECAKAKELFRGLYGRDSNDWNGRQISFWMSKTDEPIFCEEAQNRRVLAMLFMAEITKGEDK